MIFPRYILLIIELNTNIIYMISFNIWYYSPKLCTSGAYFFKPPCVNRLNQSDFVIPPNLFYQLSVSSPKLYLFGIIIKRSSRLTDNGHGASVLTMVLLRQDPLPTSTADFLIVSLGCITHNIFSGGRVFCRYLLWNGGSFIVSLGQDLAVVVRDNGNILEPVVSCILIFFIYYIWLKILWILVWYMIFICNN